MIKSQLYFFQSWDAFFRGASAGAMPGQAHARPPLAGVQSALPTPSAGIVDTKVIDDHLAVQAIIRSYQVGNFRASFLTLMELCWSNTHFYTYLIKLFF